MDKPSNTLTLLPQEKLITNHINGTAYLNTKYQHKQTRHNPRISKLACWQIHEYETYSCNQYIQLTNTFQVCV